MSSYQIFENEYAWGILDLFPLAQGHVLVIPKQHYEAAHFIPSHVNAGVMEAINSVTKAVLRLPSVTGYNLIHNAGAAAGQKIFHAHWHVIPRALNDGVLIFPAGVALHKDAAKKVQQQLTLEIAAVQSTLKLDELQAAAGALDLGMEAS